MFSKKFTIASWVLGAMLQLAIPVAAQSEHRDLIQAITVVANPADSTFSLPIAIDYPDSPHLKAIRLEAYVVLPKNVSNIRVEFAAGTDSSYLFMHGDSAAEFIVSADTGQYIGRSQTVCYLHGKLLADSANVILPDYWRISGRTLGPLSRLFVVDTRTGFISYKYPRTARLTVLQPRFSISGSVLYGLNELPVSGVTLDLTTYLQAETLKTSQTTPQGRYDFVGIPRGDYEMAPFAKGDLGGVAAITVCDAMRIFEFYLGELDPGELFEVADVNGDTFISPEDARLVFCKAIGRTPPPSPNPTVERTGDWFFNPAGVYYKPLHANERQGFTAWRYGDVTGGDFCLIPIDTSADIFTFHTSKGTEVQINLRTGAFLINGATEVGESASGNSLPTQFQLEQNYPNPFNPTTTISFALPQASEVSLAIFNLQGQLLRTIAAGRFNPGSHSFTWDARDEQGTPLAGGVYLCTFRAGSFKQTRKLTLLK